MNNARKPDESREDYHKRLREEESAIQTKLKGRLVWNSAEQGTYKKPTDETPEKPELAQQPPVYGTGGDIGGEASEDTAEAAITDYEPEYFKSKPEDETPKSNS